MRVLIIEDVDQKFEQIVEVVKLADPYADFLRASYQGEANRRLEQQYFDVVILDILIPPVKGAAPYDYGPSLLKEMERSKYNQDSYIIALTAYDEAHNQHFEAFFEKGVLCIKYDEFGDKWKIALQNSLKRTKSSRNEDFIIFCALEEERVAFYSEGFAVSDRQNIGGIDATPLAIGSKHGLIIVPPRIGLIDATVVAAIAMRMFRPTIFAITGICGGYKENCEIGQLIVGSTCWEHQAGKFTASGQEIEPYQWTMKEDIRLKLSQMCLNEDIKGLLYGRLISGDEKIVSPAFAPIVSGSAIIADANIVQNIIAQHRKTAGIDMEMYGVLRAVEFVDHAVTCFGAKVVVDFADRKKGDEYHTLGCAVSARFAVKAIEHLVETGAP